MGNACSRKFRLASTIACAALALAACASGISGTYRNATGLVTLDIQTGGKASLTVMGEIEPCTYVLEDKKLSLTCKGDTSVWGIHDDGSLSGPAFVGALTKSKS